MAIYTCIIHTHAHTCVYESPIVRPIFQHVHVHVYTCMCIAYMYMYIIPVLSGIDPQRLM